MKDPKVVVAISSLEGKHTLTVVAQGSTNVLYTVHWKLSNIEREGYVGVCAKVGNAVMRLLAQEHSEVFEDDHPMLKPPKSYVANPVAMVMELMGLYLKFKTTAYIPAIDDFFKRYPEELAKTNLPTTWLTVKEDFSKFPD